MTGLPVDGRGSVAQDHPVLVLKLDNTEASAPQQGLSHADLVVEELVEGGITRLAAFYYSDIPADVGPVRSMRASDIGIVSPVDGALVTSGGAAQTVQRVTDAGIRIFNEGSPGFYRESTRSAPYNLFTDMGKVAKASEDDKDATPDDYLPWGTEGDLPAGKPANTLTADFGSHATNWTFTNGSYVNQNTYAGAGDDSPADSVLVLRVDVGDAGYTDPAGNPVPETIFEGDGQRVPLPRRQGRRGHLDQGRPRLRTAARDKERQAEGAGRAGVHRAGPDRRQGRIGRLRQVSPAAG